MRIKIRRTDIKTTRVIGLCYVNEGYLCYSLERPLDDPKHAAIPAGEYPVHIYHSAKFGRDMMHVDNVKGRSGIEIHSGNKADDTEGCILLGLVRGQDTISDSRSAVGILQRWVQSCINNKEDITLSIG